MARLEFTWGVRGQRLAELIKCRNDEVTEEMGIAPDGSSFISALRAPCLLITRAMVDKAYFAGKAQYAGSVNSVMHHLALKSEGKLLRSDNDRVIVCDDDGDRAMSLRMKAIHQADIGAWSRRLNISRNDFVLRAIEHYAAYLNELDEREDEE